MKKNKIVAEIFIVCFVCIMQTVAAFATPYYSKDTSTDNQLTKKEKKQGWKLLFNGSNLDGWRTYKNIPGSWNVVSGNICSQKPATNQNPDLISTDEYENFQLSVDWKISPLGNSGIMYMVTEKYDHPYETGPEYQLIDDDNFPEKIQDWQKTGAAYAIQPPFVKAANTPGQWNHTIIIVNKGHVEHWLNGQKVAEYQLWSDDWKKAVANGKWKNEPDYGQSKTGHIAFQASHSGVDNTGVCFKNVKIKML